MDNVVLVTFEDEGKAYEEFNRLKDNEATADFTILEMAVVKNVDGPSWCPTDTRTATTRPTTLPSVGSSAPWSACSAARSACFWAPASALWPAWPWTTKDIDDDDSLMEYCASELTPGATALVMLAKEDSEDALDAQFDETCIIYRWDADEVNAEVERGEALRDSLARRDSQAAPRGPQGGSEGPSRSSQRQVARRARSMRSAHVEPLSTKRPPSTRKGGRFHSRRRSKRLTRSSCPGRPPARAARRQARGTGPGSAAGGHRREPPADWGAPRS